MLSGQSNPNLQPRICSDRHRWSYEGSITLQHVPVVLDVKLTYTTTKIYKCVGYYKRVI